jgi:hypothetical protein
MPKVVTFPAAKRRLPLRGGPLEPARSRQLLPLAQILAPRIDAAELKRLATATAKTKGPQQGILVVEDSRGYYLALSTFIVCPRLGKGKFLQADDFVVLDMPGGEAAARALIEAIESEASRYDCGGIEIVVPARPSRAVPHWSLATLAQHGYAHAAGVFRKTVKENGRSAGRSR